MVLIAGMVFSDDATRTWDKPKSLGNARASLSHPQISPLRPAPSLALNVRENRGAPATITIRGILGIT